MKDYVLAGVGALMVLLAGCSSDPASAKATPAPHLVSDIGSSWQNSQPWAQPRTAAEVQVALHFTNIWDAALTCSPTNFALLVGNETVAPILSESSCDATLVAPGTLTTVHLSFNGSDVPVGKDQLTVYYTSGNYQERAPFAFERTYGMN